MCRPERGHPSHHPTGIRNSPRPEFVVLKNGPTHHSTGAFPEQVMSKQPRILIVEDVPNDAKLALREVNCAVIAVDFLLLPNSQGFIVLARIVATET